MIEGYIGNNQKSKPLTKKERKKMKKSFKKADKISEKTKEMELKEKKEADDFLEESLKDLDN